MDYKEKVIALLNDQELSKEQKEKLENIFPELKESKDERIRKTLIEYIKGIKSWNYFLGISKGQMIAWLEKQGENKSVDKPKFKVRDWILNDVCFPLQIASIRDGMYVFTEGDAISVSFVDEHLHLWTIQDAMDGDVLAEDSCIFIIRKLGDNGTAAETYCVLHDDGDFNYDSVLYFDIDSTKPATKEQRDLLFQKIAEAGYEWDSEKKELKKIEPKNPIVNVPPRELILSIWDLGNEWKELTNGCILPEYGTQLDYIQKHWYESEYYLKATQGNKSTEDVK